MVDAHVLVGFLLRLRPRRSTGTLVAAIATIAWLRIWSRWWAARKEQARRCFLSLSSPLEGAVEKQAAPRWQWRKGWWGWSKEGVQRWSGCCPCCKRPIEVRLSEPWRPIRPTPEARGKFAFVINLWGTSVDYVLGALVLGHSIRRTNSPHARVCLHTCDVPKRFIALLSEVWECRLVEHVEACMDKLSFQDGAPHRFDSVFTKLRAMQLTDFEKVLVMDIDLVVTANIDSLFELNAPAALRRGMNDNKWPLRTGDFIDGRAFFLGKESSKWSWGQGTGINAGVMLLRPDQDVFEKMMAEITDANHPSHTRGNGPEQDYLSRFWADAPWTYIGVEYNYQLHQMFFSLHPTWAYRAERATLLKNPETIKIVHFSGVNEAKPWHRVLDAKFRDFWPARHRDAEYTKMFADEFLGHWLWIRKDRSTWDSMPMHHARSEMQDLYLGDDGEIWQRPWEDGQPPKHVDIPSAVTDGAMEFLHSALGCWFDCFETLQQELGFDLRSRLLAEAPATMEPKISLSGFSQHEESRREISGSYSGRQGGKEEKPWESRGIAYQWKKTNGWWIETNSERRIKLAVACCGVPGRRFVCFCEDGQDEFGQDSPAASGVFAKIAGPGCLRHFAVPPPNASGTGITASADTCGPAGTDAGSGGSGGELEEALVPLRIWADGVPPGATVLLAIVGLDPRTASAVLEALAPLGVPRGDVSFAPETRAFAAIGTRPHHAVAASSVPAHGTGWFVEKRGNASLRKNRDANETWPSCHASIDVAYASLPWSGA